MPIPSQLRRRRRELTQNVKCQAVHPVLHWGQGHPSHLASSPPANKILPKYLQSIFYYYGKNEIKKKSMYPYERECTVPWRQLVAVAVVVGEAAAEMERFGRQKEVLLLLLAVKP
jgi:hypothetical protein